MARSYRKQPVWKDHNRGMKKIANRKVRRALNRNINLDLSNSAYKKYTVSGIFVIIALLFQVLLNSSIIFLSIDGKNVKAIGSGKMNQLLREKKPTETGLNIE